LIKAISLKLLASRSNQGPPAMTGDDLHPSFDDSVSRFKEFLLKTGYPQEIIWITCADVIFTGGPVIYVRMPVPATNKPKVRKRYDLALQEKRGVLLAALCCVEGFTCCFVWMPSSDLEAESALMPSDPSDVKLSVPAQPGRHSVVIIRNRLRWFCLKLKHHRVQKGQREFSHLTY
jgi:hypothetical protein